MISAHTSRGPETGTTQLETDATQNSAPEGSGAKQSTTQCSIYLAIKENKSMLQIGSQPANSFLLVEIPPLECTFCFLFLLPILSLPWGPKPAVSLERFPPVLSSTLQNLAHSKDVERTSREGSVALFPYSHRPAHLRSPKSMPACSMNKMF